MSSRIVQNAHHKQCDVCFFFCCFFFFFFSFCQVVILCWHTHTLYLKECCWNVWSLLECWVCTHKMLIRAGVGIFLPSDLYQVQVHGWVICWWKRFYYRAVALVKMIGLFYSICGLEFTPVSFVCGWFSRNVCLGSSPECEPSGICSSKPRWRQAVRYTWWGIQTDKMRLAILISRNSCIRISSAGQV